MEVHEEVKRRCEQYPLKSQDDVRDPIVCAKLFFPFRVATWYVVEYNPVTCLAFGYVVGLGTDEWGYFSLAELVEIRIAGVYAVEVDMYFRPTLASQLGIER